MLEGYLENEAFPDHKEPIGLKLVPGYDLRILNLESFDSIQTGFDRRLVRFVLLFLWFAEVCGLWFADFMVGVSCLSKSIDCNEAVIRPNH